METLNDLVQMSQESPVEQNTGILNDIASILVNVASFVDQSDVEINSTVE